MESKYSLFEIHTTKTKEILFFNSLTNNNVYHSMSLPGTFGCFGFHQPCY